MKIPHPFIQLPLSFDAARLAAEIGAIEEAHWRPHPQGFPGNSMLPLIAVDGDPANESFAGEMRPTPHLERCAYLKQAMASFGVTLGRSRLMRLAGRAEVNLHADQGYYWAERVRVHLPIVTQPSVRFECGGAAVNMAAGECWIFDTWRQHRVINDNDDQRIHLVADTVGGAAFWSLVEAGRPHPPMPSQPAWSARSVPFDPGASPTLALETMNLPEVMTPWEVSAHLSFLLGEAGRHPSVPTLLRQASSFVRDWRALWAKYGAAPDGRPHYQRLLETFMRTVERPASDIVLANGLNLFGAMMAIVGKTAVSGRAEAARASAAAMSDNA